MNSSIEINSDALRVKASGITNAMLGGSIANNKLANSSVTINSNSLSLGGTLTLDTDDIGEGSSNLYYTDARANSAIDARVTNTFINNLSGVVADTATALATARTIALSGDVVGSVSFDGTSDVTISSTIQANSVALGTDTTGNYVATITGTANKVSVSGSGSETAGVTLSLPDDVQIADSLTVAGNLTVNGDLTYLDTTNLKIEDNLFELNANLTGSPVNDSGMLINRGNQNNGIFMWDESADKFTMGLTTADGTSTGNITLASLGTLVANLEGNVTGNVSGTAATVTGAAQTAITSLGTLTGLTVDAGSSGMIDFGDVTSAYGRLYADSTGTYIGSKSNHNLILRSNHTAALTLDTSQNATFAGTINSGAITTTGDINLGDNDKAIFGAGSDLQIYHDGSNSYIAENGTGDLYVKATQLVLSDSAGANYLVAYSGGSVNLYNNNSAKLATTSTGIDVTGVITTDGLTTSADINFGDNDKALFGAGSDLQIYHDGSDSYIKEDGNGNLIIAADDFRVTNVAVSETMISADTDGVVKLYYDNSTKLATTSTGIQVTGNIANTSGDLTLDVAGNIELDADGGQVIFKDGGTNIGRLENSSSNFVIKSMADDKDIIFKGEDGGNNVVALTLDMSDAGSAYFNNKVGIGTSSPQDTLHVVTDSSTTNDTVDVMRIEATSSGTPAVGFGATIDFRGERAGASSDSMGRVGFVADTMTSSRIDGAFVVETAVDGAYSERLRIDSSGNVGLGTASPARNLSIVDTSAPHIQLALSNDQAASNGFEIAYDGSANYIAGRENVPTLFTTNNTTALTLDASQNATFAGTAQATRLGLGVAPHATAGLNITSTNQNIRLNNGSELAIIDLDANGALKFWSHGDVSNNEILFYQGSGSGSESMRLDGSGRLGLGTTSPAYALDVRDGIVFSGRGVTDAGAISYTNTAAVFSSRGVAHTDARSNVLRLMRDGTSGVVYAGYVDFDLSRWEDSSVNSRTALTFKLGHGLLDAPDEKDVMTLRSNGNVGIGTDNPNAYSGYTALTLNNATNGGAIEFENNGTRVGTIFFRPNINNIKNCS